MKNWNEYQCFEEIRRCNAVSPQTDKEKEYLFLLFLKIADKRAVKSRYVDNIDDARDFAFVIAEELYMLVVGERYEIFDIGAFLDHVMPQYAGIYYRLKGWEKPQPQLQHAKTYFDPEHAKRISPALVNEVLDRVCTGDMIKASWDALHKYIRYYSKWENKTASRNAHLSVVLSIRRGKFVNFHLSDRDARICRLLFNRYRLLLHDILVTAADTTMSDSEYMQNAMSYIFEMNQWGEDDQ